MFKIPPDVGFSPHCGYLNIEGNIFQLHICIFLLIA